MIADYDECYCLLCNRVFNNRFCFQAHGIVVDGEAPICQTHCVCFMCEKNVSRFRLDYEDLIQQEFHHLCFFCKHEAPPKFTKHFIFDNFDCDLLTGIHIHVCAVAS